MRSLRHYTLFLFTGLRGLCSFQEGKWAILLLVKFHVHIQSSLYRRKIPWRWYANRFAYRLHGIFFLCILVLLPVLDSCSCLSKLVYNTMQYCLARNSQWLNSDLSMFCIVWKTQEPHDNFSLLFFLGTVSKKDIYQYKSKSILYYIIYIYLFKR